LICPKCGYEQEERLDCIKCGIVFNKYIAIHSTGKPNRVEPNTFIQALEGNGEEGTSTELADLRQGLRELQRRVGEVEFERAERNLIKGEMKALDQKIQAFMDSVNARLAGLDSQIDANPRIIASPTQEELEQHKKRVDDTITDNYRSLLESFSALETRIGSKEKEAAAHTASLVDSLEGRLSEIRDQAQQITQRIESTELALAERAKEAVTQIAGRVDTLEGRIIQVRDEASLASERTGSHETMLSGHAEELSGLKKEISTIAARLPALHETIQGWADKFSDLEKHIAKMQIQVQEMEGEARESKDAIQQSVAPPAEAQPAELRASDVLGIKDDLAQIRQFMAALMKKL
jgi:chromosome segregation ATPase